MKPRTDNFNRSPNQARPAAGAAAGGDQRHRDTLARLRDALVQDRLKVMDLSGERTGTDPYNSGVHRALGNGQVWDKRSR
ncbi:MAG TPA: hypothetical protein VMH77_06355 [Steroidobacteraceae bacterium]|nr:hypothetical protein [Steroidobacteraceae bacterium]